LSRFYFRRKRDLDLKYCNGQKRYDFGFDEGFYFPDCDPKYYDIPDVGPMAFRRAYVKALFVEDQRWLTLIEGYHMLVPGTRKNPRDAARDAAVKEHLREQTNPDTLKDRKAFYKAWRDTSCCADDCGDYCATCSNKGIRFQSIQTFGLDADVRRYISRYGRYQTKLELEEEEDVRNNESTGAVLSGVCDRKSNHDPVRVRGQERVGLSGEPEEVPSDQAERIEALLSYPFSEDLVT
jgi:hypothetical protein